MRLPVEPADSSDPERPLAPRLIGVAFYALLLFIVVALLYGVVAQHRMYWQSAVVGLPPEIPDAAVPAWGTTVALEQYTPAELERALDDLSQMGMVWLRQTIPWSEIEPSPGRFEWEKWDRMIEAVSRRGFRLILVLDTSPEWARHPEDAGQPLAPPADPATFGRFADAVAKRYGAQVDYYQLWDEPNLRPHWGVEGHIDPAGYAALLRAAATAIRAADPTATILTAGLAPNEEAGGYNMSEIRFLQGLYEAGAGADFDIVAVKGFGFWTGPEDRRASEDVLNWSRPVLVRQLMMANGDGHKAIWLTGGGWASLPPDWQGKPPPWGSDSPEVQGKRLTEAVERAQLEWPWAGALILMEYQPPVADDDPRWGLALRGPNDELTPLGERVAALARAWVPGPGHWPVPGPGTETHGDEVRFRFLGTNVAVVTEGTAPTRIVLDGRAVADVNRGQRSDWQQLPAQPPGRHELVVQPSGIVRGFVVSRPVSFARFYLMVGMLGTLALGLGSRLGWLLWTLSWGTLRRRWLALSEATQIVIIGVAVLAFALVPNFWLSLLLALLLWLLFLARLDLGLAAVTVAIPFFLHPKPVLDLRFSMVELLTLLCVAAWGWQIGVASIRAARARRLDRLHAVLSGSLWPRDGLDWAILFFLVLSALSPLWAEHFGVAAREFRVVVFEPVLFYWIVRRSGLEWHERLRLIDALVLVAVAVSAFGLYQWLFTGDIISAEGVRRIRGVYPSPNNLALFLGRVVPIAVVFALPLVDPRLRPDSRIERRAWLYAFALLVIVPTLFLTFSRGAWLLGVPAALAYIAWRSPARARTVIVGALVLIVLALLPFAATERVRSVVELNQGTWFVRLNLWLSSLDMLRDRFFWLRGVGLDNFLYLYQDYIRPEAWREPDLSHPHNIVLHYWLALGLLGIVALLWKQTAFWRAVIRAWRWRNPATTALVLGLSASMVDTLSHGLIDNSYFLVDLAFVFMLTAALVGTMVDDRERPNPSISDSRPDPGTTGGGET